MNDIDISGIKKAYSKLPKDKKKCKIHPLIKIVVIIIGYMAILYYCPYLGLIILFTVFVLILRNC